MSEIDLSSVARAVLEAPAVPFRRAVAVGVRIDGALIASELLYGKAPPGGSQQPPRLSGRVRFPIYSITKTLSALCSPARRAERPEVFRSGAVLGAPHSSFAPACRYTDRERLRK